MSRTSKREVVAVFARLCDTIGVPQGGVWDAETRSMSRGLSLDHASAYGGWTIAGHSGTGSGESRPLGERRMPAGEFVAAMHVAIRAVDLSRDQSML